MNVEHNTKLNETEIICPSEISLDEKNIYNDSILKSLKESQYHLSDKSNILLNSLKEFSNRYDLDDRKIMKSKKFLISFKDLINLIKFALEFQIKISNSLNECYNEISQDFINNLSYYIFSFDKIDVCKQNEYYTKNNKNLNSSDKFSNINQKNNKIIKKKNEEEKQNIYKNKLIKYDKNQKNIKEKRSLYLNIKSPINKIKKNKKNETVINHSRKNNKSAEKRSRSNAYFTLDSLKNEDNKKKILNKSVEKRRNMNQKEKTLNKNKNTNSFSIFTACENIKNSSFIIKLKNSRKSSYIEQNKTNKKKNTYYNQHENYIIKKEIFANNIIRPSNMANKLLQKGIKYINDFANLKEEECKKKYY